MSREFQEIVVEYPPEDLCTYPEYKGKPYFGIKYKEGDDYIIGYGTYKPEVLSGYLRDYFMSSKTPQEHILDKIRTEIKALSPEPTAYDVVDGNPIKDAVWETMADVLEIIDKYRAESEEEG